MRKGVGLLALCCGLLGAAAVEGQGVTGFMGRASAVNTVNRPIDTAGLSVAPLQTFSPSFSLTGLFRSPSSPSFPPKVGRSPLPPPSAFPSTRYPNAFNPVKPIIPKPKS